MNKLLIITGPTASGKTDLAAYIAAKIPAHLISADSRQVYKNMDIVTGKDRPKDIAIAGYDLVRPDEEFSVSQWVEFAASEIRYAWKEGLLPIVIGGTGFYIKSLLFPPQSLKVRPDAKLRQELYELSVPELQEKLAAINPDKLVAMNDSDRFNPRRLIRAIEVSLASSVDSFQPLSSDNLILTLKPKSMSEHAKLIEKRVRLRLKGDDALTETKQLIAHYDESLPAFSALGYGPIIDHLKGKTTRDELIDTWVRQEVNYAKSQMTWLKSQKDVRWFTIGTPKLSTKLANLVESWYD